MSIKKPTPVEGQYPLFIPDRPIPIDPFDQDEAIQRGKARARQMIENPDSFGHDWPSIQIARERREKEDAKIKGTAAVEEVVEVQEVSESAQGQVPQHIVDLTAELHAKAPRATIPQPLSQREQINKSQLERLSRQDQ